MAYAAWADVQSYLGLIQETEKTLIENLIGRAQKIIENELERVFEAAADSEKEFGPESVYGRTLYFGRTDDLAQVSTVVNGDGTTIDGAKYRILPLNERPGFAIQLNDDVSWEFDDVFDVVTISGRWAYSVTVPDNIKHATIRLTAWLYRQRTMSSDLNQIALSPDGVPLLPNQLPADVLFYLDPYRRP